MRDRKIFDEGGFTATAGSRRPFRLWAAAAGLFCLAAVFPVSPASASDPVKGAAPSTTSVDSSSSTDVDMLYAYKGEQLRDPFIPLVGQGVSEMSRVQSETGAFN